MPTIRDLIEKLDLKIVQANENALNKTLTTIDTSRPGLELANYFKYFDDRRIQILGKMEISYIDQMDKKNSINIFEKLLKNIPAVIISRNLIVCDEFLRVALKNEIAVLSSSKATTRLIASVSNYLDNILAQKISLHGVFVEIYGMGVLLQGDSGIGKSEIALELLNKGHRLITDDRVDVRQLDEFTLTGEAPEILHGVLELRGVGIINVEKLFGVRSVKGPMKIDLAVYLEKYLNDEDFDRLGNNFKFIKVLDVDLPQIKIPVKSGRNLATIVEVATLNYRAKKNGFDATEEFINKMNDLIIKNSV